MNKKYQDWLKNAPGLNGYKKTVEISSLGTSISSVAKNNPSTENRVIIYGDCQQDSNSGSNLLDQANMTIDSTSNGITISWLSSEKCFNINGTSTADNTVINLTVGHFAINRDSQYVFGLSASSEITAAMNNCTINIYGSNSSIDTDQYIWASIPSLNAKELNTVATCPYQYITKISFVIPSASTTFSNFKFVLFCQAGSLPQAYEEYTGTIYQFPTVLKSGSFVSRTTADSTDIKNGQTNVTPNIIGGYSKASDNLVNIDEGLNDVFTKDDSGNYSIKNDSTLDNRYSAKIECYRPSGTYTISAKLVSYDGTSSSPLQMVINFIDDTTQTVTLSSTTMMSTFMVYKDIVSFQFYQEESQTDITTTFSNFMFSFGTANQEYSEYYSDIRSAKVLKLTETSTQLIPQPYISKSGTSHGITWTINSDFSIIVNGTADATTTISIGNISLKSGTYTLSGSTLGSNSTYQIFGNSKDIKFYQQNLPVTKTIDSDFTIAFAIYIYSGYTANNLTFYPMFNRGTVAKPYEQYKLSTLNIPADIQALSDYGCGLKTDDISLINYIDYKQNKYIRNAGSTTFDGSEDEAWDIEYIDDAHTKWDFFISLPEAYNSRYSKIISNQLLFDATLNTTYSCRVLETGIFEAKYQQFNTVANLKTYLAAHPLVICYKLKTSESIDISDKLTIDKYIDVTNLGTESFIQENNYNIPAYLDMTYQTNPGTEKLIMSPNINQLVPVKQVGDPITINSQSKTKVNLNTSGIQSNIKESFISRDTANGDHISAMTISKIGGYSMKSNQIIPQPYSSATQVINGIKWTVNSDYSITADGSTTTAASQFFLCSTSNKLKLVKGQTYTLSGCASGGSSSTYMIVLADSTYQQSIVNTTSATTAVTAHTDYLLYLRIQAGTRVSKIVFHPMLNIGGTALPYEEYFRNIHSNSPIMLQERSKNLFHISESSTQETNGITYTIDKTNQTITINGTSTVDAASGVKSCFDLISSNKNIISTKVMSGSISLVDGAINTDACVAISNAVVNPFQGACSYFIPSSGQLASPSATFTSAFVYLTFWFDRNAIFDNLVIKIQVEKGDQITSYTDYSQHLLIIPSAVTSLTGYGFGLSTTDCNKMNYIDYQSKQYVQNIQKLSYNGTESWVFKQAADYNYCELAVTNIKGVDCLSNKFSQASSSSLNNDEIFISTSGLSIRSDEYMSSLDTWKSQLAQWSTESNPLLVYCLFETAQVSDLSTSLIQTNVVPFDQGTETFIQDNDFGVPVYLDATYTAGYPLKDADWIISEPIRKISTYIDSLNNNEGKIHRKISSYTFIGTENWTVTGSGSNEVASVKFTDSMLAVSGLLGYSNAAKFENEATAQSSNTTCMAIKLDQTSFNISWYRLSSVSSDLSTNAGIKAALASKYASGDPVIIYYVTTNETEELLDRKNIRMSENTTMLDSNNTTKPSAVHLIYQSKEH